MLNPSPSLAKLLDAPIRPGRLISIGLRPARREPVRPVETATLVAGRGLTGDRYSRKDGNRQVTLIEAESLAAIAGYLDRAVSPEDLRRNLVTQGINLLALKGHRFRIGDAVLETSGECHPCSRMEEILGTGGYNAVRGRGGITARVLEGGVVRAGDAVARLDPMR
ncbi:MAG: MOSC domain-containing protein [Alphaproteobacteria bacterium]|nr:MOSC domain-containing protein [Alphaproteobacteria bacterium]MBU1516696.1 MOSC domain-containing protein [Alphaproteobacteria bacterium]MBU2094452.1 MOSC domain-containing protein [Alphaproteobacteria bacterium]MBU2152679.1 MOSC domain-containing protein [Alphaproteobacteria bacterium]MBU2306171.1 MOSC domain-containing protein [Alphaproteobacteria bacterium]